MWPVASGAVEPSAAVPPGVDAYASQALGVTSQSPDTQFNVFEGDFTGDGQADAVAFIYYPSGGSAFYLDVSLFERRGGELVHSRVVADVFGFQPRDVTISPGLVEVTTTTLKPGDPLCCPTGETRYQIKP